MKHSLIFTDKEIEISEVVKYDAFAFELGQEANHYGRFKTIGGKTIPIIFWKGTFEPTNISRVGIDGNVIFELTHCFEELLAIRNDPLQGFEAKVYYKVSEGTESFINGMIDFAKSETDEATYISCNIVQDTEIIKIERKDDVDVNVFGVLDLKLNPIVPVEKVKVLVNSIPVNKRSIWSAPEVLDYQMGITADTEADYNYFYYNTAQQQDEYEIQESLNWLEILQKDYDSSSVFPDSRANNFGVLRALFTLTDVKLNFSNVRTSIIRRTNGTRVFNTKLKVVWGFDITNPIGSFDIFDHTGQGNYTLPTNASTATIPYIPIGATVWVYFKTTVRDATNSNSSSQRDSLTLSKYKLTITANETYVDSVIDAVPYDKFISKGIENISSLSVVNDYIKSGEFSNQFVCNGLMLKQQKDIPFNFVFKNEMNDLKEVNLDYQIGDTIEILPFEDFYADIDMGFFDLYSDENIVKKFNERTQIISLGYKYKHYETSELANGTAQSFHTETQRVFPNENVENKISIDINHIRDGFAIQKAIVDAVKTKTAQTNDDKVFIFDCIEIGSGTQRSLSAGLNFSTDVNGRITITNIAETENLNFDWTILGFIVGGQFIFEVYGGETRTTTVYSISRNIIVLNAPSIPITINGYYFTKCTYYLNGVLWQTRTNQEFQIIENIDNSNKIPNLKYSIGKNLEKYGSMFNTICSAYPNGKIKNSSFKNNGKIKTQFQNGSIIVENEDVEINTLREKIITQNIYELGISISFKNAVKLIDDIQKIKGFIRFKNKNGKICKGYVKNLKAIWSKDFMNVTVEEKFESDVMNITKALSPFAININEVGYTLEQLRDGYWFEVNNSYLRIFDVANKDIINPILFTNVNVGGTIYTDKILFVEALLNITI